jgi:hypothetical protein
VAIPTPSGHLEICISNATAAQKGEFLSKDGLTTYSLHDIMDLESRGIPAGFIASCEFVEAANAQAKSLGIHPASVFVSHPIQGQTDAQMVQLAQNSIDAVAALIYEQAISYSKG